MLKGRMVAIKKNKEVGYLAEYNQLKDLVGDDIDCVKVVFADDKNILLNLKEQRVVLNEGEYFITIDGELFSNDPKLEDLKKVLFEHFNTDMKFSFIELVSKENVMVGMELEEDAIIEEMNKKLEINKSIVEKGSFVTFGIYKIEREDEPVKYIFGVKGVAKNSQLTDKNTIEYIECPEYIKEQLANAKSCLLEEVDTEVVSFVNESSILNDKKYITYGKDSVISWNEYLELKSDNF